MEKSYKIVSALMPLVILILSLLIYTVELSETSLISAVISIIMLSFYTAVLAVYESPKEKEKEKYYY